MKLSKDLKIIVLAHGEINWNCSRPLAFLVSSYTSFRFILFANIPLPNKKYGNDMANLGPYMAHMWK